MKDEKLYLQHILVAIEEIKIFTADSSQDDKTLRAAERDIEIIGEASRNLGRDFHIKYPSIPRADIIGMRNKVSHDYFGVDRNAVWLVVIEDIPVLEKQIRVILQA